MGVRREQCRDLAGMILADRKALLGDASARARLAAVILSKFAVQSCDEVPQVSRLAWRQSLLQAQDRGGGWWTLSFSLPPSRFGGRGRAPQEQQARHGPGPCDLTCKTGRWPFSLRFLPELLMSHPFEPLKTKIEGNEASFRDDLDRLTHRSSRVDDSLSTEAGVTPVAKPACTLPW